MKEGSNPNVEDDLPDASLRARLAEKLSAMEREISSLFDRVPFGSHTESADGTFLSVNALESAWLGYSGETLVGKRKFSDFLTPQSLEVYRQYRPDGGSALEMSNLQLNIVRRNGNSMPIALSTMREQDSAYPSLNKRFMVFDLTEKRHHDNRQNISAAVFESPSGTFITDQVGNIQHVNNAFTSITGYSAVEAVGQSPRLLSSGHHDTSFYDALWNSVQTTGRWQGEIWNRRKNGEIYVEWLSISTVVDRTGAVTNYVGSFTDITAAKDAQDQLSHLAYHDALTQLPNRRLFFDRLSQTIAASRRSQLFNAILYIDLDHFKAVNDTCGHETGDLVLIEVARRLRHAVREGDSVARLSGDEFVVLLEGLDSDRIESATKTRHLGEKILAVLSQKYTVGQQDFHCTASIGMELFQDSDTASELLQRADLAMYQSKNSGKNTLRFFDQSMQSALAARVNLEAELHEALAKQQFTLFIQPQMDRQRQMLGAEVLLRWAHPKRGLVSPLEFIPLAEETRLILRIGSWVLKTACDQLKAWEHHPVANRLQLAVNVSPLQFHQDDFVAQLSELVAASGINPRRLKLEITESMVLDIEGAITKMEALQKIGLGFSMDDFGTGFSSLSVLTRLPIQQLKIDQSFVRNIGLRDADGTIVQTIIAMAHTLGFEVIAEGVETEVQCGFLEENGCKHFQGYLFGKPIPIGEFESLLLVA